MTGEDMLWPSLSVEIRSVTDWWLCAEAVNTLSLFGEGPQKKLKWRKKLEDNIKFAPTLEDIKKAMHCAETMYFSAEDEEEATLRLLDAESAAGVAFEAAVIGHISEEDAVSIERRYLNMVFNFI